MDLFVAYKAGFLFRLGMEYAINPKIARMIKPDWSTIAKDADFKEGDHPRDKDGKFKSGSGSSGSLEQAKKKFDELSKKDRKYALKATSAEISKIHNDIASRYPEKERTNKQVNSLNLYKKKINALIQQQSLDIQRKIKQVSINPDGLSVFPEISNEMAKKLGIKNKQIVLTLYCQKRILAAHRELDAEALSKGLAFSLYTDSEIIHLKSNAPNYKRFGVVLDDNTFHDVIFDIQERNGFYEIVHFHKNKNLEKERRKIEMEGRP